METATKVLCVFEGGGAKGVAHVGALRAIENVEEFEIKGFAGTSAGAIVAALAAVGWRTDDLVKKHDDGKIESFALKAISDGEFVGSLAELFKDEWKNLKPFKGNGNSEKLGWSWLKKGGVKWTVAIGFLALWPILYHVGRWMAADIDGDTRTLLEVFIAAFWLLYVAVWARTAWLLYRAWKCFQGLASMDPIIEALEKLFSEKVKPHGERVTFRDIKEQTGFDLKIVAANIHSGSMELFDSVGTPSVPVADAVAASACIPVAFAPVEINGQQYCDGGIVSNLPAWTFDDERLLDEECLVITCELPETASEGEPHRSGIRMLLQVGRTALFGSAALSTRGLQTHIRIPLTPDIGLLEFDDTKKQLLAIDDAEVTAKYRIDVYLFEKESLREIAESVRKYLQEHGIADCALRTALVREVKLVERPAAAYKLWCTEGYDGYTDGRLLLPRDASLVGKSIHKGSPQALDLTRCAQRDEYFGLPQTFPGVSPLPTDRKWAVAVPLQRLPEGQEGEVPPICISVAVTLDGDIRLPGELSEHLPVFHKLVDKHSVFTPC